jgi:hypothetical protein
MFGDVDNLLSFVNVSRLDWISCANTMENKGQLNQVFANKSQESRLTGRPRNGWYDCVQTDMMIYDINCNWVSCRWHWSVNLHKYSKEAGIYKRRNNTQTNTKTRHIQV